MPILYLDVNLGNQHQTRMVLNKGDDYLVVVQQFAHEF